MPRTPCPLHPRLLFALGAVAAALGLGSLPVRAVEAQEKPKPGPLQAATAKAEPGIPPSRTIKGVILDDDGDPASGAVVVGGLIGTGTSGHQVFTTDSEGRFSWPIPAGGISVGLFAHKPGRVVTTWLRWLDAGKAGDDLELELRKASPDPFAAVLVDGDNMPVAGARVRVEISAHNREFKRPGGESAWSGTGFLHYHREVLGGSPLEPLFVSTTDGRGAFSLRAFGADSWLRLAVTSPDGRELRVKAQTKGGGVIGTMMDGQGFVSAPPGKATRLVVYPAARVQGRVVTKLAGVGVSGLKVSFQSSRVRKDSSAFDSNFGWVTRTDADGRFTLDGLDEGTINIFASDSEVGFLDRADAPWTYRAARDVELKSGRTRAAMIELIRGIVVEGKVLSKTGQPLGKANVGIYGPMRPRSGAAVVGLTTDAEGHYRHRLPPGETYVYVMGHLPGHADRTVTLPEGVDRFEIPPIVIGHILIERGRITDAAGRPVPGATVTCVGENGRIFGGVDAVTDPRGAFRLPPGANNSIPVGKLARLRIRLRDGSEREATALPASDGSVMVKLP